MERDFFESQTFQELNYFWAAKAAYWVVAPQTMKTRFSPEWQQLIGWSDKELGEDFSFYETLIPPDQVEMIHREGQRYAMGEVDQIDLEHQVRRKDGSLIWLSSKGRAVAWDENGLPTVVIGIAHEITPLKTLEQKLADEEEHYRTLFMMIPDGAILVRKFKVDRVNPSALRLLGYDDAKEMEGMSPLRFIAPHHLHLGKEAMRSKGGIVRQEFQLVKKNGEFIDVSFSASWFPASNPLNAVILMRDVTEERLAQDRLQQNEERLSLALESGGQGVWDWNIEKGTATFSPSWLRMIGYEPGELKLETVDDWQNLMHPEDSPKAWQAQLEHMEGRSPNYTAEFRMRHKDGHWVWVLSSGLVTSRDENGKPQRILGTHTDISNRKGIEDEVRRLNAVALQRAKELEGANAEIRAFSYSVSHDLRSPLRSIDGYTSAIQQDYGSIFDDEGRFYLSRIRSSVKRMGELIDALLRLARTAQIHVEVETIDLSFLARNVFEAAVPIGTGAKLTVQPGLEVQSDRQICLLILENLIGNAIKFKSPDRELEISIGHEETHRGPAFFVKDNGIGFDMKFSSRLFKPFERLHGDLNVEGHGIGLATVQAAVARVGGQVWAESEPGQGATFWFTL